MENISILLNFDEKSFLRLIDLQESLSRELRYIKKIKT